MTKQCYCSFCGKGQKEVAYLFASEVAMICNECVDYIVATYRQPPRWVSGCTVKPYLRPDVSTWDTPINANMTMISKILDAINPPPLLKAEVIANPVELPDCDQQ